MVKQWTSDGATVLVEQCCGTLEQLWWNSGTVMVEHSGATVEMSW